jgi:hypothetical protein
MTQSGEKGHRSETEGGYQKLIPSAPLFPEQTDA